MTSTVADVRQVQLALLLTETGARFVVAGGTARLLRGDTHVPKDLDLVVRRVETAQLHAALQQFSVSRAPARPTGGIPWDVRTSWSPVDVFVEDGLPAWHTVEVDGLELRVADE